MRALMRHRGRITLIEMMMAIVVVSFLAVMALAPTAQAAEFWKQRFAQFSATAGETLATGDVVCIYSADSQAYKADADDAGKRFAVGVIDKGGAAGETVGIVISGILTGQTAASAGSRLYLSATAGAFTVTSNAWGQVIGMVMEGTKTEISSSQSTTYFVQVMPISASGEMTY